MVRLYCSAGLYINSNSVSTDYTLIPTPSGSVSLPDGVPTGLTTVADDLMGDVPAFGSEGTKAIIHGALLTQGEESTTACIVLCEPKTAG